jgi:hypothetical protein
MRARDLALIFLAVVGGGGCGGGGWEAELTGDVVLVSPPRDSTRSPRREGLTAGDGMTGAHLMYVHVDGLTLGPGADDPRGGRSVIVGKTTTIPAFDAQPYAATLPEEEVRSRIVARIKQHFAPFAVEVLRARPPAGVHHTMCLVGGVPSLVNQPSRTAGLSPLDCDDAQADNVVFVFSEVLRPEATGSVDASIDAIAIACSHEAGHAYGLGHTQEIRDVMAPRISRAVEGFAGESPVADDGAATCVRDGKQDSQRLLAATVGRARDAAGPEVAFVGIAEGGRVPPRFIATVSALVPGETVRAVEIWADGRRVAVSEWPPYRAEIEATPGRRLQLYAAARGDDGLLAEAELSVEVDDAVAPPAIDACRVHADCTSDTSCIEGRCRAPILNDTSARRDDRDDEVRRGGFGCSAVGGGSDSGAPIAILAACIALALVRIRRLRAAR